MAECQKQGGCTFVSREELLHMATEAYALGQADAGCKRDSRL